jgi:RNA polymerase sigma factor (sigma-70 family)
MTWPSSEDESPGGSRESALGAVSDRDCVVLSRGGSREAQTELVERHMSSVYRLCLKLLRSRDDAADATQEVFVRAFSALPTFDIDRSFRAWLCAIAWNFVRDQSRRAKHRAARPISGEVSEPPDRRQASPLERAVERERADFLDEALGRLEPPVKALLVLREMEGLSYEEISELFGCSLGTVKSRIHRARMELKNALVSLKPQMFGD